MSFEIKGSVDDCIVTAHAETAKEAFAKAVEWQVANGVCGVSISDGGRRFTVAEFSWKMASAEMAETMRQARRATPAYSPRQ
jgi:hypothetical protein